MTPSQGSGQTDRSERHKPENEDLKELAPEQVEEVDREAVDPTHEKKIERDKGAERNKGSV
jgi:hypothetical protein